MALLCFEAQDQHDPEHTDNVSEALKGLQQQLNVSVNYVYSLSNRINEDMIMFRLLFCFLQSLSRNSVLPLSDLQLFCCMLCLFSADQRWGPCLCAGVGWKMPG